MKPSEALANHRDKLLAIAAGHGASNLRVFGSLKVPILSEARPV